MLASAKGSVELAMCNHFGAGTLQLDHFLNVGACRCGVCACVLTRMCVDGRAVMFRNITSYMDECVAALS